MGGLACIIGATPFLTNELPRARRKNSEGVIRTMGSGEVANHPPPPPSPSVLPFDNPFHRFDSGLVFTIRFFCS